MSLVQTGTTDPSKDRSITIIMRHPINLETEMGEIDNSVGTVINVAFDGYDCWRGERPLPASRKERPKVWEQTQHIWDMYPLFPGDGELTVFDPTSMSATDDGRVLG
ncbi:hypothetical protein PspLS_10396 [Pyricularia sp. CBS 133598]|nr:hypothetical protein PspLS_10396 [Pyricularia sp. CBS 133598]